MINDKLYKLENGVLTLYTHSIEMDIYNKTKMYVTYDIITNIDAKVLFFIQENISFVKLRTIKKYFLTELPYCINVYFDNNFIIVELSREHGLNAIKEYN